MAQTNSISTGKNVKLNKTPGSLDGAIKTLDRITDETGEKMRRDISETVSDLGGAVVNRVQALPKKTFVIAGIAGLLASVSYLFWDRRRRNVKLLSGSRKVNRVGKSSGKSKRIHAKGVHH